MQPLISVIIPNYNHTHFISNAIQSVLAQTYSNFEIIVVDDGSTDDSQAVIAGFGDKVHYIWQENQGLGAARNTGIRAAAGEFVALLDADDQWNPDYLENMILLTDKFSNAGVYYCCAQGIDDEGYLLPQKFGLNPNSTENTIKTLLKANFIIPSTVLIRRSVVVECGYFDQHNRGLHGCEDWDLWLRIAPDYELIGTDDCFVRYRIHDSSLSANIPGMQRATRAVIEKHFGPDDDQLETWSVDKRRAYGGLYRYYLLTSVQRQGEWRQARDYLRKALQFDPTLAEDLESIL